MNKGVATCMSAALLEQLKQGKLVAVQVCSDHILNEIHNGFQFFFQIIRFVIK